MIWCMRTTIRLPDDLLRKAREYAARNGKTLTAVIEEALRRHLAPLHRADRDRPPLPTYGGSGLLPGVDLDDTSALFDLMESSG